MVAAAVHEPFLSAAAPLPPPAAAASVASVPAVAPFGRAARGLPRARLARQSRAQCEAVVLTRSPSPALVAQAATRAASTRFGRWESTNANSCAPRRRPVWRSAMSLQAALARPRPGARKHRQTPGARKHRQTDEQTTERQHCRDSRHADSVSCPCPCLLPPQAACRSASSTTSAFTAYPLRRMAATASLHAPSLVGIGARPHDLHSRL